MRYDSRNGLKIIMDSRAKERMTEQEDEQMNQELEQLEKERLLMYKTNLAAELARQKSRVPFPVLGANLFYKGTDHPYAQPHAIIEREGVRVGVKKRGAAPQRTAPGINAVSRRGDPSALPIGSTASI